MKKKIIIVTGDPLSINTEIINKVWKKINRHIQKKIVLIGNYNLVSSQLKKLKSKICLSKLEKLNDITKKNDLKIIDVPIKNSSQYIVDSLTLAHELALNKEKIKGIINWQQIKDPYINLKLAVFMILSYTILIYLLLILLYQWL